MFSISLVLKVNLLLHLKRIKMSTFNRNVYLTQQLNLSCSKCKRAIKQWDRFVVESENSRGLCFKCSPFTEKEFLPSGDSAMTRRSKKHSRYCGVLLEWNSKRRRFERKGQCVEADAIIKARAECKADADKRKIINTKLAFKREMADKIYVADFAKAIKQRYPSIPKGRELAIAKHACEKYSGRVGRSASAKQFDGDMIDRAVEAHIRHHETSYDSEFGKGKAKRVIRSKIKPVVVKYLSDWRKR